MGCRRVHENKFPWLWTTSPREKYPATVGSFLAFLQGFAPPVSAQVMSVEIPSRRTSFHTRQGSVYDTLNPARLSSGEGSGTGVLMVFPQ